MKCFVRSLCIAAALACTLPLSAVTLGQVQTFNDPVSGWVIGAGPIIGVPTDVPIEPTGGPAGAGDPYMSIVSSGASGPGSKLSAQNFGIWSGNYIAAGVGGIFMDVRNFGPEDVYLRLLFLELGPMGPVNGALTSNAVFVPAGSGWETIGFDIAPGALTLLLGSVPAALSNATELRIFHNPDPSFPVGQIPAVAATVGVDNITAVTAIPEPASWALLLSGLVLLRFRKQ